MNEQKIRYLVTQSCSNDLHNGALGVVSIDSNNPREDEQLLISQVESCQKCKFHSMFYAPEKVVEIKRTLTEPIWIKKVNKFLGKLGFAINFIVFVLLVISISLSEKHTFFGDNFERYAVACTIAGLCLASITDENTTNSTKLANVFALAVAVIYFVASVT